jgi:DNA modification methylase
MKIESIRVADLSLDPSNVRKHSRRNLDAIKASLRKFGQQKPIVIDAKGIVLAGNGTLTAAQELGWTEISATRTELTGVEATAFAIADNRTAELAEWDEKLDEVLKSLLDAGQDLADLGFTEQELAKISSDLVGDSEVDAEPQIDKADELRAKWGVEPGQLWQMGEHRIACGDSTSAEVVARLLGDEKPHLMVTDPPYGVEYDASWRQDAGVAGAGAATGKVMNDDRADWTEAWELFGGDVCYVWHADKFSPVVARSLETNKFQMRALIVWAKSQHTFGRGDYHSQHEPCWYAVRKGAVGHYNGDRTQSTLWEIDKPQKSETGHSTQKPIECMERPIRNNSNPGDLIYEPFSGSGTTIIACERTKRKCRAIELSPAYVAVALQRWADATGKTPIKL